MKLKIREIRKSKKITQRELARISGVSKSAISRYESGEKYPPIDILECIALALNVKLVDLFDSEAK